MCTYDHVLDIKLAKFIITITLYFEAYYVTWLSFFWFLKSNGSFPFKNL